MHFRRPLRAGVAALTAVAAAVTLTACSSDGSEDSTAAASGETITVEHALGTAEIQGTPERVATVGWSNQEVPLALGVVPVGMPKADFGDDDGDGLLPWVSDKLQELGGETPELFDETDSIPFEKVAETDPDVILGASSGISQEDYDQLSAIAPTVAYPGKPWMTSLDEMIRSDAKAIGKEDEGEQLIEDLHKLVADEMAARPELAGKKVLFTSFGGESDSSKVGFYNLNDPRGGFLKDAGFGVPEIVEKESQDPEMFWSEVSAENPEVFDDVDAFVSYGSDDPAENEAQLKKMQADPLLGRIPAIREGHVTFLGNGPVAAAANPSPLGLSWGLGKYLDHIDEALK